MVIDFDSSKKRICGLDASRIDVLLERAIDDTHATEDRIDYLTSSLAGLTTFRKMLRYAKRRGNIEEAIARYAFDSCPPSTENELCGEIPCSECWNCFFSDYAEEAGRKTK